MLFHFREDPGVIGRVGDHGDRCVVLGSASQHRGPPDIDILDGFIKSDALLGDGLLEGVEIDDYEIDGGNVVLLTLGDVFGGIATLKEAP